MHTLDSNIQPINKNKNKHSIDCAHSVFSSNDPNTITLLQAPPHRPQVKTLSPKGAKYGLPSLVWGVHLIHCPSIEILGDWLKTLEHEKSIVLIRGCPRFEVQSYLNHPSELPNAIAKQNQNWANASTHYQHLSQLKRALKTVQSTQELSKIESEIEAVQSNLAHLGWYPRSKAYFEEVPRNWVCLDLDEGLNLANAITLEHETDHQSALRWIVQQSLPKEFEQVSFIGQWSSSAFLKGERLVKGHFSFLLDQPMTEDLWKNWMGKQGENWPLRWDPATCRTVQPHFTAKPIFEGLDDPLQQRTFIIKNSKTTVKIDPLSLVKLTTGLPTTKKTKVDQAKSDQVKSKKTTLKQSKPESPISPTSPAFQQKQLETLQHFRQSIEMSPEGIRTLEAQKSRVIQCELGQRNTTLYQSACLLGRYISGKQIDLQSAIQSLLEACQSCGLIKDQGEQDCLRQIRNGIYWGLKRPIQAIAFQHQLHLEDQAYHQELQRKIYTAIYQAQIHPKKVPVLALTCGAGKTTALCAQVAQDASVGKTRVVLCRNHEMAEAFAIELWDYAQKNQLRLKGKVRILEGMTRACQVFQNADPTLKPKLRDALKFGRQALCGQGKSRCQFAKNCTVADQPKVLEKGLTIATHAMGPLLKYPKNTVVIIDELPSPVETEKYFLDDLKKLIPTSQLSLGFDDSNHHWLDQNPQISLASQALIDQLQSLIQAKDLQTSNIKPNSNSNSNPNDEHAKTHYLSPEQSLLLLQNVQTDFLPLALQKTSKQIKPASQQLRQGKVPKDHINPKLIEMLSDLAEKITQDQTWPSALSIQWNQKDIWLEYRKPYVLADVPLVALDGTAHRTALIWQYLLKPTNREMDLWTIAAIGKAPLFSRWIKTQQLRSPQLIKREKGLVFWKQRSVGAVKRVAFSILQAVKDAQVKENEHIGILASKHLADLFRLSIHQSCEPAFRLDQPYVQELITAIQQSIGNYSLKIGHIGAHDIGSNLYQDVALLAMLGSSKPDWGATLQDLKAIGLPQEEALEAYTQIVAARDVQALARARHLRRDGIALLYVGDMTPPTGHDLPDVHWTQVEAAHPKANSAVFQREQQAIQHLMTKGYLTVPELMSMLSLTRAQALALCQRLERQLELVQWKVIHGKGRPSIAYGLPAHAPIHPELF